ncbi:hypothetical protein [Mycobacteroides abscessus]|uniref:hypothetical protein n=1 Tax=Mycobacteroides abscessus TaxID=36809 RepID=UPI0009A755A8|nr:hypothetical protein [Mycobacteroides abscessus]SKQ82149.1 Uncharacterised protein [Mycobacteroides abscessus subsp. massiliense]
MAIYTPPRPIGQSAHIPSDGEAKSSRLYAFSLAALGLSVLAFGAAGTWFLRDVTPPIVVTAVVSEPAYTASEVSLARDRACTAWDSAATAMAAASNAAADAPADWDNPVTKAADANDTRTTLVQTAYLRNETSPATPKELADSLSRYEDISIEIQHASIQRMASTLNQLSEKLNAESRSIQDMCGLS